MPRKAASFSRSDIRAAWNLLKSLGEEPVAVKLHEDGTFRILTAKHAAITAAARNDNAPKLVGSADSDWDAKIADFTKAKYKS